MKQFCTYKTVLVSLSLFCFSLQGISQAAWEVNALKSINPQNPSNDLWRTLSSTTHPVAVGIPLGMLAIGLIDKDKSLQQKAYEVAGSFLIASATTLVAKKIINRPRPYLTYPNDIHPDIYETDPSFPSGHVSAAFATAASVSLQYKKWYVTVPMYAWGAGVAYSRMYLGQHYPSDVVAGAAVGIGSAYLAHWLNKKLFPKKK